MSVRRSHLNNTPAWARNSSGSSFGKSTWVLSKENQLEQKSPIFPSWSHPYLIFSWLNPRHPDPRRTARGAAELSTLSTKGRKLQYETVPVKPLAPHRLHGVQEPKEFVRLCDTRDRSPGRGEALCAHAAGRVGGTQLPASRRGRSHCGVQARSGYITQNSLLKPQRWEKLHTGRRQHAGQGRRQRAPHRTPESPPNLVQTFAIF